MIMFDLLVVYTFLVLLLMGIYSKYVIKSVILSLLKIMVWDVRDIILH
jgi:hypothetical protein